MLSRILQGNSKAQKISSFLLLCLITSAISPSLALGGGFSSFLSFRCPRRNRCWERRRSGNYRNSPMQIKAAPTLVWYRIFRAKDKWVAGAQLLFFKSYFWGVWDGRAAFAFGETQHGERKKRGEANKGPSGHKQKEEEEDVNWSPPPPPSLLAFLSAE